MQGRPGEARLPGFWLTRSLASRLVLVLLVFLAVPVLVYQKFRDADVEKQDLLLRSAQQQGQLIARALQPTLEIADARLLPSLGARVAQYADDNTRVKILLRPAALQSGQSSGFYYVAAAPAEPNERLDRERETLREKGVLARLAGNCEGDQALAIPVPGQGGGIDLLTSVTPIRTPFGCWAIVTSHSVAAWLGSGLGRPYWEAPEVQAAALIYVAMAALVLLVLLEIWRNVRRFRRLAREIGSRRTVEGSFAQQNSVPELAAVAEEFDRLVETMHNSAVNLRRAAEDNAHAFKTPIAIIRQAVEPLKRLVAPEEARGRRALDMIEGSIDRLDGLVSFARRMDETAADLLEPPRQKIDLSALLQRVLQGYNTQAGDRDLELLAQVEPGIVVRAGEDLLETVIENIVDNAFSFTPAGGAVRVQLRRGSGRAELDVVDDGPGIEPMQSERIFERYFSQRPRDAAMADTMPHYGIGLWIVRRNVEAIGGQVDARNLPRRGLAMRIRLPLAD